MRNTAYFELGRLYSALRGDSFTKRYDERYQVILSEALTDFICFTIEEKHFSKWDEGFIKDLSILVRQVWNALNHKNSPEGLELYQLVERADLYFDSFLNN